MSCARLSNTARSDATARRGHARVMGLVTHTPATPNPNSPGAPLAGPGYRHHAAPPHPRSLRTIAVFSTYVNETLVGSAGAELEKRAVANFRCDT